MLATINITEKSQHAIDWYFLDFSEAFDGEYNDARDNVEDCAELVGEIEPRIWMTDTGEIEIENFSKSEEAELKNMCERFGLVYVLENSAMDDANERREFMATRGGG